MQMYYHNGYVLGVSQEFVQYPRINNYYLWLILFDEFQLNSSHMHSLGESIQNMYGLHWAKSKPDFEYGKIIKRKLSINVSKVFLCITIEFVLLQRNLWKVLLFNIIMFDLSKTKLSFLCWYLLNNYHWIKQKKGFMINEHVDIIYGAME